MSMPHPPQSQFPRNPPLEEKPLPAEIELLLAQTATKENVAKVRAWMADTVNEPAAWAMLGEKDITRIGLWAESARGMLLGMVVSSIIVILSGVFWSSYIWTNPAPEILLTVVVSLILFLLGCVGSFVAFFLPLASAVQRLVGAKDASFIWNTLTQVRQSEINELFNQFNYCPDMAAYMHSVTERRMATGQDLKVAHAIAIRVGATARTA